MSAAHKYQIGPLTTYASEAELTTWFRSAAPGHKCTYAIGPALGRHPTAQLALRLAGPGQIHAELKQERDGAGFRYVIQKKGVAVPVVAPIALDEASAALLDVLRERAGQVLPSYATLADLACLSDRHAARYRLARLEERGLIAIDAERVVSFPVGAPA